MATKKKILKTEVQQEIEPILKALNMSEEESESRKGLKIILEALLSLGLDGSEIVDTIRLMIEQY